MRVAVSGTPGTGKTTAVALVDSDLDVVHLNELVRDEGLTEGTDEERGSSFVDLDAVSDRLADRDDVIIESHLSHYLDVDSVIVLRCHPDELERRLLDRDESESKARENAEAEALDVVLSEAVDRHGADSVYEIDTTDRSPSAVSGDIEAVIADERAPSAGNVDFTEYL